MQEELALDMQILEKLLTDTRNEALEISQRKVRKTNQEKMLVPPSAHTSSLMMWAGKGANQRYK